MISNNQHGFLKNHSTVTNLLESINDWTSSLEKKFSIKILYIDFAKAFDTVSIPKLLIKLRSFGIDGPLFLCIKSFLTNRVQKVKVGKALSQELAVISGVPQGSVLGPFLFLLFINDLPNIFEVNVDAKLFADDLKAYNLDDYKLNPNSIQTSLDALVCWANTWQLQLAVPKCGSLLLKSSPSFTDHCDLLINNTILPAMVTVKDLGVVIDCDLSFRNHISEIISKAKQRIYLLFKSFSSKNISLMVFAYKVYVLPILEYGSVVWSPCRLGEIDRLEDVQRYYTKRLESLWSLSYEDRLKVCSLKSLELRRLWHDLILCFKIVHKLVSLSFSDFFEFDPNTRTRGHSLKLRIPLARSSRRHNFFACRVTPIWNALPWDLVICNNLNRFKSDIRLLDLSRFLNREYDQSC